MRYQGEITDWKDDLGYRFVLPKWQWRSIC